jgi:hypothetical protein
MRLAEKFGLERVKFYFNMRPFPKSEHFSETSYGRISIYRATCEFSWAVIAR